MNIIQQPDSLSLSMNVRNFLIGASSSVSFVLKQGAEVLVSHQYDPGGRGVVEIDVRDIVHARLSYHLQDIGQVYQQTRLVSDFTAIIDSTEVTFKVIRGGVDRLEDTASVFLTQNFLTWQPQLKRVTYYTPEFLTYYAVVAGTAKLRAYFTNASGTVVSQTDYTIATLTAGIAYTLPLQYAVVVGWLNGQMPAFYDVWIENTSGQRLTYIQRYAAEAAKSLHEEWVLWENSLGGLDTFRAYGMCADDAQHTHNIAEIDEESEEYRVDTERLHKKDTGYLQKNEATWLLDFFPSLKKYIYLGNYLRQIVVTESGVTRDNKLVPTAYTFTYKYADARPLLNLPRTEVPATALNIILPDVGSFTLPPRLAEVARQPLSEGVLFPVQNPYSEEWGTTTIQAITDIIAQLLGAAAGDGGGIGHIHYNYDLLKLLSYVNEYLLVGGQKIKAGYADKAGDLDSNKYIRKDKPDETNFLLKLLGGMISDYIKSQNFTPGALGTGFLLDVEPETGCSYLEIDKLFVRRLAYFVEIVIKRLSYVGGEIILSPASMTCSQVEEHEEFYRCFFQNDDGTRSTGQEFVVGDQARCQTFNIKPGTSYNVGNQYYWRLVVGVGENYIDLSKTDCDTGSTVPAAEDDIVQLGNRTNPERQNAQILSSYGIDSPSYKQYQGINSYSLEGKEKAKISPSGNRIIGDFVLTTGKDVATQFDVLEGKISSEVASVRKELSERDNILSNASLSNNTLGWETAQVNVSYTVEGDYLMFFGKPYMWKRSVVGVTTVAGNNSLRIKNGRIIQLNGNFVGHPTFEEIERLVTDAEGYPVLDKEGNLTYTRVIESRVFTLEFYYYCKEAGTLTVGFEDVDKTGFEPFDVMGESVSLGTNSSFVKYTLTGKWNGTGNFYISFSGDIYIQSVLLTDDKLTDIEYRFNTKFEQTDKLISMNAAAIKKTDESLEEKYAELKVTAEEISATVSENYTELNDRYDTLSDDLDFWSTYTINRYTELKQTSDSISAAVSSNYTEVIGKYDSLSGDFDAYMTTTSRSLAKLELKDDSITTEVSNVKTSINNVSGQVTTLEENFSSLRQDADSISATVADNKDAADRAISTINTTLGNLEDGLSDAESDIADANGTITTISDNLDAIGVRVTNIEVRESGYATTTALQQTDAAIAAQASKWDDLGTLVSQAGFILESESATLYAAKEDLISLINAAPEGVTISGDKIDLIGKTTFSTKSSRESSVWIEGAEIMVYSSRFSLYTQITGGEVCCFDDNSNIECRMSIYGMVASANSKNTEFGVYSDGRIKIYSPSWPSKSNPPHALNAVWVDGDGFLKIWRTKDL